MEHCIVAKDMQHYVVVVVGDLHTAQLWTSKWGLVRLHVAEEVVFNKGSRGVEASWQHVAKEVVSEEGGWWA